MLEVYDNGGETIDRYTIYITGYVKDPRQPATQVITTSGDPDEFWQHGYNMHPYRISDEGERISVLDLPSRAIHKLLQELEAEGLPV